MGSSKAAEKQEESFAPVDAAVSPHADIPGIMSSLPVELGFPPYAMRWYRGFWLTERCLKALAPSHARFRPRPTDVLITSFPKSGTTWLKALAFSVLNREAYPPRSAGADHPLHRGSPHDLVGFIEHSPDLLVTGEEELYQHLASPRLLASHLPYSLLPRGITADGSECKVVYVCRDPKDTLVSFWHFHEKTRAALQQVPGIGGGASFLATPTFEEAFELFCQGKTVAGPQWNHALEYWEASRRRPDQVLFLSYEDMLRDTPGNLRRLAAFVGWVRLLARGGDGWGGARHRGALQLGDAQGA
ncbi:unnamed protein product [Triticum aestivum]|uniref:Sulfotransferase n=2 Tax=Triticum aestivum TaxID=4565 RepID=A0A9R1EME6_WHEAT|nr:hypothetical protein CFC21_027039 [Triticum aestivum]SPT15481.1 unnamed protein product [Triticum aestivum]